MALLRCTCLSRLSPGTTGVELIIDVADPECGYVVHRMADLAPVEPTH